MKYRSRRRFPSPETNNPPTITPRLCTAHCGTYSPPLTRGRQRPLLPSTNPYQFCCCGSMAVVVVAAVVMLVDLHPLSATFQFHSHQRELLDIDDSDDDSWYLYYEYHSQSRLYISAFRYISMQSMVSMYLHIKYQLNIYIGLREHDSVYLFVS